MIRSVPMRQLALAFFALLAPVAVASEKADSVALHLRTGGGPPGSDRFDVQLGESGHLSVVRRRLPMTATGLTETRYEADLPADQVQTLLTLAVAADDFSKGCGLVADGTDASLRVVRAGKETERTCEDASRWPVGSKARSFLDALNALLPSEMRVF